MILRGYVYVQIAKLYPEFGAEPGRELTCGHMLKLCGFLA
jgi:hypothetical protein